MSEYSERINAILQKHASPGEALVKELAAKPSDKLKSVADLATFMVPEMAIGKGLSMLPKIGQYLQRGDVVPGIMSNAGAGATQAAIQGEDPGQAAMMAGGLGGAFTGAGKVLQRAVGGPVAPLVNEDAQELLRQGVVPTVGQATRGNSMMGYSPTNVEDALSFFPLVGQIPLKGRARADKEAMNKALADFGITSEPKPNVLSPTSGPPVAGDWMKSVDAETNRQYRDILSNATPIQVTTPVAKEVTSLFKRSKDLTSSMLLNPDGSPSVIYKLMSPGAVLDGEEIHQALSTIKRAMPAIDNASASTLHQSKILGRLKNVISDEARSVWGSDLWDEYQLQNFNNVNTEALRRSVVDAVKRGEESPTIRDFYKELNKNTSDKVLSYDESISGQLLRPAVNTMTEAPGWSDRQNVYRLASLLAPTGAFATGNPTIAAALLAPALASGSRRATRYMLGDYPVQPVLEKALKRITPYLASMYSGATLNSED